MTESLINAGAARRIEDVAELAETVAELLGDLVKQDAMAKRALEAGFAEEEVLERIVDVVKPLLDSEISPSPSVSEPVNASA